MKKTAKTQETKTTQKQFFQFQGQVFYSKEAFKKYLEQTQQ